MKYPIDTATETQLRQVIALLCDRVHVYEFARQQELDAELDRIFGHKTIRFPPLEPGKEYRVVEAFNTEHVGRVFTGGKARYDWGNSHWVIIEDAAAIVYAVELVEQDEGGKGER